MTGHRIGSFRSEFTPRRLETRANPCSIRENESFFSGVSEIKSFVLVGDPNGAEEQLELQPHG